MCNSYATKLSMISCANNDEKLIDNSNTDSSNGKECEKVFNKESTSHMKSKLPCDTNDEPTSNSRISLSINNDDNNLMNAYL